MIGSKRISFFFFRQRKGGDEGEGHGSLVHKEDLFHYRKGPSKLFCFFISFFKSENDRPILELGDRIRRWTLNQLIDSRTGKGANNIHVHFSEFFYL